MKIKIVTLLLSCAVFNYLEASNHIDGLMFDFHDDEDLNTYLPHSDSSITIDDSGDSGDYEDLGGIAASLSSISQSIIISPRSSNGKKLSYEERLREIFLACRVSSMSKQLMQLSFNELLDEAGDSWDHADIEVALDALPACKLLQKEPIALLRHYLAERSQSKP